MIDTMQSKVLEAIAVAEASDSPDRWDKCLADICDEAIVLDAEIKALRAELLQRCVRLDYYMPDVSGGPDIMMGNSEYEGRRAEKVNVRARIEELEAATKDQA